MGERLAGGNVGLALLASTAATGAALLALMAAFGPLSGAHFNPVVTVADRLGGGLSWGEVRAYIIAQMAGGVLGTAVTHLMFARVSGRPRTSSWAPCSARARWPS